MIYPEIVVLGSCSIDFTSYAPRLPVKGETLHGTKFTTSYGGKGANQCIAAAKLGGKTSLIARLGDDKWGPDYKNYLETEGIDTTHTHLTVNSTSGVAQIAVSTAGDNQIIIVAGSNGLLSKADVQNAKDIITNAKVLICQLETPIDATEEALRLCTGVSILNAAPAQADLSDNLLQISSILCVNEVELSMLTGYDVTCTSDAVKAINQLMEKGCKCVLVTLGSKGVVFATKEEPKPIYVPVNKVIPVDTTGAGDAFIGAFAFLTAQDPDRLFQERVALACAAASYSVQFEGTQASFIKDLSTFEQEPIQWNFLDLE